MKMKQVFAGVFAAAMIVASSVTGFASPSTGPDVEPCPPTDDSCIPDYCVPDYCVPVCPVIPGRVIVTPGKPAPAKAPAKTNTSTPAKKQLYRTESKIAETEAYKLLKQTNPDITDIIDAVNAGEMEIEELALLIPENDDPAKDVGSKLIGKDFVTPFFDLAWVDGVTQADKDTIKNAEGKYVVDLNVPALTKELTGVQLLHYSIDRGEWEIEDTTALDLEKKTLSVGFKDFSPVAVIADFDSIED